MMSVVRGRAEAKQTRLTRSGVQTMTESPAWFNFPSFFRGDREGERHHVEAAAFRAFSRFVRQGLARDGLQRIVRPVALLPGRDRLAAADVVRELSPPAAPK